MFQEAKSSAAILTTYKLKLTVNTANKDDPSCTFFSKLTFKSRRIFLKYCCFSNF